MLTFSYGSWWLFANWNTLDVPGITAICSVIPDPMILCQKQICVLTHSYSSRKGPEKYDKQKDVLLIKRQVHKNYSYFNQERKQNKWKANHRKQDKWKATHRKQDKWKAKHWKQDKWKAKHNKWLKFTLQLSKGWVYSQW